jgi:hypothetical protein
MGQPREVADEEHERVWERVAAIDVAKGSRGGVHPGPG